MRYYSGRRIKVQFGDPVYEIIGESTVRCTLPYKVYVPGMYSETLGLHLHLASASEQLAAVGTAKLAPGDTFNGEIGRRIAEARAEEAAYRHVRVIVQKGLDEMLVSYSDMIDNFYEESDKIIDHNVEFAANIESIILEKKAEQNRCNLISEPTLFDDLTETEVKTRNSNGRDVTPVVCVKKEGDHYRATEIAVTRKDMENITGVDSRVVSNSSKYNVPIRKGSNISFYCVKDLTDYFEDDCGVRMIMKKTRQMTQQNNGRKVGEKPVPYVRLRGCFLIPKQDCTLC